MLPNLECKHTKVNVLLPILLQKGANVTLLYAAQDSRIQGRSNYVMRDVTLISCVIPHITCKEALEDEPTSSKRHRRRNSNKQPETTRRTQNHDWKKNQPQP